MARDFAKSKSLRKKKAAPRRRRKPPATLRRSHVAAPSPAIAAPFALHQGVRELIGAVADELFIWCQYRRRLAEGIKAGKNFGNAEEEGATAEGMHQVREKLRASLKSPPAPVQLADLLLEAVRLMEPELKFRKYMGYHRYKGRMFTSLASTAIADRIAGLGYRVENAAQDLLLN